MEKLKIMINDRAKEKFRNLISVYCIELGVPTPCNLHELNLEELQNLEIEMSREIK